MKELRIPLLYQSQRPVLGPFLAGLLALASQEETDNQRMLPLFVYGLRLGIPFVLTGLIQGTSRRLLRQIRAHFQLIVTDEH